MDKLIMKMSLCFALICLSLIGCMESEEGDEGANFASAQQKGESVEGEPTSNPTSQALKITVKNPTPTMTSDKNLKIVAETNKDATCEFWKIGHAAKRYGIMSSNDKRTFKFSIEGSALDVSGIYDFGVICTSGSEAETAPIAINYIRIWHENDQVALSGTYDGTLQPRHETLRIKLKIEYTAKAGEAYRTNDFINYLNFTMAHVNAAVIVKSGGTKKLKWTYDPPVQISDPKETLVDPNAASPEMLVPHNPDQGEFLVVFYKQQLTWNGVADFVSSDNKTGGWAMIELDPVACPAGKTCREALTNWDNNQITMHEMGHVFNAQHPPDDWAKLNPSNWGIMNYSTTICERFTDTDMNNIYELITRLHIPREQSTSN